MIKEKLRNLVLRFPELYRVFPTMGVQIGESLKEDSIINADVISEDAVLFHNGKLMPEMASSARMMRMVAWKHCLKKQPSISLVEPYFFAGGMCSDNYWHMMIDILPQILKFSNGLPIVVSSKFNFFDMFSAFGIGRERICILKQPTRFEKLLVVPHGLMAFDEKIHTLKPRLPAIKESKIPRIYISRKDASRRRIINEDEVIAMLKSHGFEIVSLSPMRFLEQLSLFSGAGLIVMPHGAASANLLVSGPATKVIEIMPSIGWGGTTIAMCQKIGAQYQCIEALSHGSDIWVDVADLERML